MTTTTTSRPCFLYRLYGERDTLLYVGISVSALGRLGEHLTEKSWATEVRRTTIDPFPSRTEAAAAEVAAIRAERPLYNIQHNGKRRRTPRAGGEKVTDAWFGAQPVAESMPDMCHDYCLKVGYDEFDDGSRAPVAWVVYYPHRWTDGLAHYTCDAGHSWTCTWGHHSSGEDRRHLRCRHVWVEPDDAGRLACCDCSALIHPPAGAR